MRRAQRNGILVMVAGILLSSLILDFGVAYRTALRAGLLYVFLILLPSLVIKDRRGVMDAACIYGFPVLLIVTCLVQSWFHLWPPGHQQ